MEQLNPDQSLTEFIVGDIADPLLCSIYAVLNIYSAILMLGSAT